MTVNIISAFSGKPKNIVKLTTICISLILPVGGVFSVGYKYRYTAGNSVDCGKLFYIIKKKYSSMGRFNVARTATEITNLEYRNHAE